MPEIDQTTSAETRQPLDDGGSLSDHEAQFSGKPARRAAVAAPAVVEPVEPAAVPDEVISPDREAAQQAEAEARDPNLRYAEPKPKERHRAQSQKARAEDVPRIKELTRKLKEAEEALTALKTQPPAAVVTAPTPAPAVAPPEPAAAKFAFPTIDAWLTQHPQGSYEDWQDAKYDARDAWRDAQRQQAEQAQAGSARQQALTAKLTTQVQAYRAAHPDYDAAIEALKDEDPPALLFETLIRSDKFPDLVHYLATHPVERHELHLITDGKPITDQHVASVRRLLDARVAAGSTGAAPAVPAKRLPSPPTPVRTGPMRSGDEPPGDGASLAEHEAYFTTKRR